MTKKFKKIFIDTNVLIYQTFEDFDRAKHIQTTNTIQYFLENNTELYISPQVIREFFSISTNGKFFEKPLNVEDAIYECKECLAKNKNISLSY